MKAEFVEMLLKSTYVKEGTEMNTLDIAKMILDCFANAGECISAYGTCESCKYYNTCSTIATAYRMVLEGEYYG